MSELYIYDDDLVEDYNLIETLTKKINNSVKENKKDKNKILAKEENTKTKTNTKTNTNKSE